MDRNELPFEPRHLGVPSGASKTISEAMVYLAQSMHLSCTETNTVPNGTKQAPFEPHHLEYHPVHPTQFLSLWCVLRKPSTYHALKLRLSPKGPKGDST
jgi:hypothetical protein